METLQLHDLVALTEALPDYKLRRGEVGVIIDIGPDNQCLLEFSDRSGVPYATPTVLASHLLKVYLHADLVE
jgi:hypothetical protein